MTIPFDLSGLKEPIHIERHISADKLKAQIHRRYDMQDDLHGVMPCHLIEMIDELPDQECVPMDYHQRCLMIQINKRIQIERKVNKLQRTNIVQNGGSICNIDHVDVLKL